MNQNYSWLRPLGVLLVLALVALNTPLASAHADYTSSVPAANATVAAAPTQVVIVFSEEVQTEGSRIVVKDASGAAVDQGNTALDKSDASRTTLVVSLKAGLPNGSYTVEWTNASTDGHSEEGSFRFTIGTPTPGSLPQTGGDTQLPLLVLLSAGAALSTGWQLRRRAAR